MTEILTDKWYLYPHPDPLFVRQTNFWSSNESDKKHENIALKNYQDQGSFILPVSLFESHICRP